MSVTSKKINYLQNEKHKHGYKQNHKVVIIHHTNAHVRKYLPWTRKTTEIFSEVGVVAHYGHG